MTSQSDSHAQNPGPEADPQDGVSRALADRRARLIRNLTYALSFDIPAQADQPVSGRALLRFDGQDLHQPLVLDFAPGVSTLTSVTVGGKPSAFRVVKNHLLIPEEELAAEGNEIQIAFVANDAVFHRNPEFVYTLFVPARAHLAFPCFDQPNLKARFTLELNVPSNWQAVSNGAETSRQTTTDRLRLQFAETQPIPTYLFAFAAGAFQVETETRNGRVFRLFHRETDAGKVERNRNVVFDLHAASLDWLERYTAMPYPFGKFDVVLIPSFEFGGMEHPGAIFYNAASLLLTESATESQILDRASLIAHETSHMWFGDLVTMHWFNDVWLKEVFANFMAAKIVHPLFPEVNHDLRFLVSHYPAAYAVDRTEGTHPIRQDLENLNEAGSLYGPIIYQKAPIVMRQLERILGEDKLQEGLRTYLRQFQFANARWPELIRVLDALTAVDLEAWSHSWIEEAGRPSIRTFIEDDHVVLTQSDPEMNRSLHWTQQLEVLVGTGSDAVSVPAEVRDARMEFKIPAACSRIDWVLPNGGGLAYGDLILDDASRAYLLQHLPMLNDPLTRGAAWITLWEETLDRRVDPLDFVELSVRGLAREDTEQNVQLVLGYLRDAFWIFLQESQRAHLAPQLERVLRRGLERGPTSSLKATYFEAFRSTVLTQDGIAFLERAWRRQERIPALPLTETDEARMALDLAVRSATGAPAILEEQRARFSNPDRKAQFEFVMPAASSDSEVREAWFERLRKEENRRREPWVLEGLSCLHHPLRDAQSERFIEPAFEMLPEIQRTGDIFFPARWVNTTLGGHRTTSAARIVRDFLTRRSDLPIRLRRIILQAADKLFRATASPSL